MRPVDFLHKIWGRVCEPGDYVFLSIKDPRWKDFHFKWDASIKGRVRDWLRQNNPENLDVYFCPLPFRKPERLAKYVKPVNLLWSDVDDGDPKKLRPTVLWESSPGRHHALWFIKDRMNAEDAAQLNRSLTYHLGADKGGWDLSQVLRIPGTYNHKYKSKPQVKLLHWDKKVLTEARIANKIRHKVTARVDAQDAPNDIQDILQHYSLSRGVLNLLLGPAEEGRRSDVIWYLENKLNEAGMSPNEIIQVIKGTEWNKYAGRADEDHRLRTELSKVIEKQVEKPKVKKKRMHEGLEIESFRDVMSSLQTSPGWQIPGFWMRRSHGIVAGEPKSFKSTMVMDMALSIASGAPFLGKYPVDDTGPVLYIQNENAHWIMKDRFEKMLVNKNLVGKIHRTSKRKLTVEWPPEIPFYMVNQQSFMLSNQEDCDFLEETIKNLKPELVVLDPLYLMFDGDIGSAQDLFPILQFLLYLKNTYNCGICVIHHYNKSGESKRGGQRMLGSTTLHGWIESAWYLQALPNDGEDDAEITMEREFRGAGLHHKLDIRIEMGDLGVPEYNAVVVDHVPKEDSSPGKKSTPETMINDVMSVLNSRSSVTEAYIGSNTGYNNKQVREIVDIMIEKGLCYRESGKVNKRSLQ